MSIEQDKLSESSINVIPFIFDTVVCSEVIANYIGLFI